MIDEETYGEIIDIVEPIYVVEIYIMIRKKGELYLMM